MARPSKFTQELLDEICLRLSGGEPLAVICRSSSRFPTDDTVRQWAEKSVQVSAAITRARDAGWDHIANETRETARRTHVTLDNGLQVPADPQRDKLIIDTDLKLLAVWDPKRYGAKQFVEHSGSIALTDMSEEDMIEELLALIASGRVRLPEGVELVPAGDEDDFDHESLA